MDNTTKHNYSSPTYSLAKAFHNLQISKDYFEAAKGNAKGSAKQDLNMCINKIQFIQDSLFHKCSPESQKVLKEELSDSLCIDSINDNLIHLTNEQRLVIEELTSAMIKGDASFEKK